MLAAVYKGGDDLELVERPLPEIGSRDVLLKVGACAVCGTDRRILHSGHRGMEEGTERILGHELSGRIVETGSGVEQFQTGMRVAVAPNVGCGRCDLCVQGYTNLCENYRGLGVSLDGGFAETMVIPGAYVDQGNIEEIPDELSYGEAALNEPLSCCYHGLRACGLQAGERVLVVGAGPIGVMMVKLAKTLGAAKVVVAQRSQPRRDLAVELGADAAYDPQKMSVEEVVSRYAVGRGFDVAVIAAPSAEAQARAIGAMAKHGRVNFFGGLPKGREMSCLNANLIHYGELVITGTTGQTVSEYRTTMELLRREKIRLGDVITGEFSLRDIHAAFEYAESKRGLKAVVYPQW